MSTSRRLCSRAPRTAIRFGSPAGTTGGVRRCAFGGAFRVAFAAGAFAPPFGTALATAFDGALARVDAARSGASPLLDWVPRRSAIVPAVYSLSNRCS